MAGAPSITAFEILHPPPFLSAPSGLPGIALLLSSRLEGRSRILPLVFRVSFNSK